MDQNLQSYASVGGDRFPQWSIQETRDLLMIRAELDSNFMENKRNKILWELVSTRMKEKGFSRSPHQCKGKWKNLVTRFKGCEAMETEAMKQHSFPFYNDLKVIFAARMQRIMWLEAEAGGAAAASSSSSSKRKAALQFSSDEEDDLKEESEEEKSGGGPKKKRKIIMKGNPPSGNNINNNQSMNNVMMNGIKEIMEGFMNKQVQMEIRWLKAYEEREEERRAREMEWRQTMEALENERLMMDKRWREREEQWKIREEARAEKRDSLITALLHKLRRDQDM
ncbi:trihelix transcription factor GT-3b-like [Henckelia pumila]|uniref:trihelix transcription factor GT-3b-like n=1 Tax=Henckelia pumila TaxID=405737 RepID=UPI003C6E834E